MATKKTPAKKTPPKTTPAPTGERAPAAGPVRYLENPSVPKPVQVDNTDHDRHGQAGYIVEVNQGEEGTPAKDWSCSVKFDQDDTTEEISVQDLKAIR